MTHHLQGNLSDIHSLLLIRNVGQRQWNNIFKELREKIQPRILYPAELSFNIAGEIKTFLDKWKNEFVLDPPYKIY